MRLGFELDYVENLTKPGDPRNPDDCERTLTTKLERFYIRMFGFPDTVKQQQAHEVFAILDRLSFSSVLDIGCGQGHYSIEIARRCPNCRVKAIDVRDGELNVGKLVKEKFGINNLTFEKRDVYELSNKEKYDLVLLLQVIEQLEDDKGALKKIKNILSDSGHLIITTPNLELPNWYRWRPYVRVKSLYRGGYRLRDLVKVLLDSGFKIKKIKYLSGALGELIEKLGTYFQIKAPPLFSLSFPLLSHLVLLDKYFGGENMGSGIFVVATLNLAGKARRHTN